MKKFNNLKESIITKLLILVIIPWIILAIIFGISDLIISKSVVSSNPLWGELGDHLAYTSAYILICIAFAIVTGSYIEDLKQQKIVGFIISLFLIETFTEFKFLHEREDIYDFLDLIVIFGVLIFSILTLKKDWKEYIRFAIVILLLTASLILFVEITKFLCGRVRFRDLNSNYSNYTPWFLPPGPDSKNSSFPSGHAALGWIFLPLLILIRHHKWRDPIRILISMFVIGWGLFIAISRVLIGAHYASDVLFSTGAAAIITVFLYKWFYLNKQEKK